MIDSVMNMRISIEEVVRKVTEVLSKNWMKYKELESTKGYGSQNWEEYKAIFIHDLESGKAWCECFLTNLLREKGAINKYEDVELIVREDGYVDFTVEDFYQPNES